jgi:hypothetical protein
MTLRKAAGLLAVTGLMVGLLGSGVGASFVDSVTGTENISVGTFQCIITDSTQGTVSGDNKSVTYNAPEITSSAAGSAPFDFTVKNNGSIPMALSVSVTGPTGSLDSDFSDIPATLSETFLDAGESSVVSTGIEWDELEADDLGDSGSMIWTVSCEEFDTQNVTSAAMLVGPNGWYGWSCPAGTQIVSASVSGGDYTSLTLWKPGASASGYDYPSTPFGYTYGAGEEGAIVQNDNDAGETQYLHLVCTA